MQGRDPNDEDPHDNDFTPFEIGAMWVVGIIAAIILGFSLYGLYAGLFA